MAESLQATKDLIEEIGVDEVERFQRAFIDTTSSRVLDLILMEEKRFWTDHLTNMNGADSLVRQAQGGYEAIKRLRTILAQLLEFEASKTVEEDETIEEELEHGDDNIVY